MPVKYLKQRIVAAKRTPRPQWGMAADGYTVRTGAPTTMMILLEGESRWRRLMIWQFSNAGTVFVRIKGTPFVVNEYDIPECAS